MIGDSLLLVIAAALALAGLIGSFLPSETTSRASDLIKLAAAALLMGLQQLLEQLEALPHRHRPNNPEEDETP